MRWLLVSLLILCGAAVITSRFVPKINQLDVVGNVHHDRAGILRLAGLAEGDPFLWVTDRNLRRLARDPWIGSATIVRVWPERVSITIDERRATLTDGLTSYADDGTVLPGATAAETAALPRLTGWGAPRTAEAIELMRLLRTYQPQVISYSPEGFEIQLSSGSLFTPSVEALREQWSAFVSHRGGRIAVYPWGVSTANE